MDSCLTQVSGAAGCQTGWRRQFAQPSGVLGWLAGHLLALKNRKRSEWVLSLVDVRPGDHVLEIGFGPGVDIRRVSERVEHGFVAGIDPSREMVRQATRRNAVAVETGLAELLCASAERIPYPADSFDKVYAINSLQFSADLPRALQEIGRVLKPAGVVSVAVQPRLPGATERRVDAVDAALQSSLREAGFSSLTRERKMMKPVSCVCVMAAKPADFGAPRIGAIQTGQRTAGQARAGEATAAEATAAEAEPRQTEARRAGAGQAEAGQAGSGRTRAAAPRR